MEAIHAVLCINVVIAGWSMTYQYTKVLAILLCGFLDEEGKIKPIKLNDFATRCCIPERSKALGALRLLECKPRRNTNEQDQKLR